MNKHQRQSFLGSESENILKSLRVAIIGLGGGGSHIAQQLAHVGVGNLFLFDFDMIDKEGTNLNRLVGATEADVKEGKLKVDIAKRH
jgi:tRNA A37 threonylcarbamoyladenosine dehydratase